MTDRVTGPGGSCRILIVDDSVTIRAMLEHVISADRECSVVGIAADVVAARALIRTMYPDVVTLDLAMPGFDGLAFLQELEGQRHPPIVVVSSSARPGTVELERALALGAVAGFDKARILADAPILLRLLKRAARAKRPPQPLG